MHVPEVTTRFRGNYMFCSTRSMYFSTTSRTDDLFSLLYILLYVFTKRYPFSLQRQNETTVAYYKRVRTEKQRIDPESLCEINNAKWLMKYAKEISTYEFTTEPHYNKLRFIFQSNLLDMDK